MELHHNANNSLISSDSLGSELDMLRQLLKQRERELADKELIIKSLRQRETDLNQEIEELENNEQLMTRTIDRLTKEVEEKNSELEAVSHALKEVETAYDTLNKRTLAKTGQVQQFADSLAKANKELEETQELNKQLQHKNDLLVNRLSEMEVEMKRTQRDHELQSAHPRTHLQKQKLTESTSRNVMSLAKEMRFTTTMEEDIMESRSTLPTLQASERVKPEPCTHRVTRDANIRAATLSEETKSAENLPMPFNNKPIHDPIAEYKMRMARANELARRNQLTKALHQTSYPLELDTFGDTDIKEQDIKRGNIISMPQRAPPPVPSQFNSQNNGSRQSTRSRQALSNCSNTPPVARKVYKKAEAFIV